METAPEGIFFPNPSTDFPQASSVVDWKVQREAAEFSGAQTPNLPAMYHLWTHSPSNQQPSRTVPPSKPAAQPLQGLEKHLRTQNLYKTELCRSWTETGTCRCGTRCQFAHGVEELRPRLHHPKYKTQLCKDYHSVGICRFGTRCRFIHSLDEANPLSSYAQNLPSQTALLSETGTLVPPTPAALSLSAPAIQPSTPVSLQPLNMVAPLSPEPPSRPRSFTTSEFRPSAQQPPRLERVSRSSSWESALSVVQEEVAAAMAASTETALNASGEYLADVSGDALPEASDPYELPQDAIAPSESASGQLPSLVNASTLESSFSASVSVSPNPPVTPAPAPAATMAATPATTTPASNSTSNSTSNSGSRLPFFAKLA